MQSRMRCFLSTISEKRKLTQLFPYVVSVKHGMVENSVQTELNYPFSLGKFKSWITSGNRLKEVSLKGNLVIALLIIDNAGPHDRRLQPLKVHAKEAMQ